MAARKLSLRTLVFSLLMVIAGVIANWSYRYEIVASKTVNLAKTEYVEAKVESDMQVSGAGWPSKFLVRVQHNQGPAFVIFRWERCLLNLALWCTFTIILIFYEQRLDQIFAKSNAKGTRRLSIFDLLIATSLVAAAIAYFRMFQTAANAESAFANEIVENGGIVEYEFSAPSRIAGLLRGFQPQCLRFARATEVTLWNPTQSQVERALSFPYLEKLFIGGGSFDLRLLDQLSTKPLLNHFRLSGRVLDEQSIAAIGAAKQLVSIELTRTNITANGIASFGEMPRLQMLKLIHTDVVLSEFRNMPCGKTIRTLYLPRPKPGLKDHLQIEGWSALEKLVVDDFDDPFNHTSVLIELKDLPNLSTIELEDSQLFALKLTNLPQLAEITPISTRTTFQFNMKQFKPNGLWLERMAMSGVSRLSQMKIYAANLSGFEFSEPLDLRLMLFRVRDVNSMPSTDAKPIPSKQILSWFESIADGNGPKQLELFGISLKGVELTPLDTSNLFRLGLADSGASLKQILNLTRGTSIRELDLRGCEIDGRSLALIVSKLPDLSKVFCHRQALGRIRLEQLSNLERIFPNRPANASSFSLEGHFYSDFINCDALQLVGMPLLKESFDLPPHLIHLRIDDAPSLTGLSLSGPLPKSAVLKGLRDLEYLTLGGELVDDAICDAILACTRLSRLTLAYTKVTPECLGKLANLQSLTSLTLSGSKVNDSVIQQLSGLNQLTTLRLDDTDITDSSVAAICNLKQLQVLSLHRSEDHGKRP